MRRRLLLTTLLFLWSAGLFKAGWWFSKIDEDMSLAEKIPLLCPSQDVKVSYLISQLATCQVYRDHYKESLKVANSLSTNGGVYSPDDQPVTAFGGE